MDVILNPEDRSGGQKVRWGGRPQRQKLPNCTVGFVYNEPCPLHCSFCCHTKENVGPGRMTPSNVTPVVLKYALHPDVTRFAFTGGDPFIFIEEIINILTTARKEGVTQPFHIVTSGFWAKTDEIVERRLSVLKSLGMDMLYVSYDLEHKKWVPPEFVYRIDKFCKQYDIILSIYGIFWEEGVKVRDLLPNIQTPFVNQSLVAPIGRARTQNIKFPHPQEEKEKYSCLKPQDYDITIYPNGDTYPCCSGGFNKEAKLYLGNSFTDEADAIIERCYRHFFVRIAKEIGFDKLYNKILEKGLSVPGLKTFSEVTTVCEVCCSIHSNEAIMAQLQPIIAEMEIEYCLSQFSKISEVSDNSTTTKENIYATNNC